MRTKVMKVVCLLVVLVFAMSMFTACNKDEDDTTGKTTKSPGTTKSGGTTDEVKWSGNISVASYRFGPMDESKDVVTAPFEEGLKKYGYDVTLEEVYVEWPQYEEIINVRLAGGTAPDIWVSLGNTQLQTWYDQGAIKTWDRDFFVENAPDLVDYFKNGCNDGKLIDHVSTFWELSELDGKMVTIPKFTGQNCLLFKVMAYRTDWLDKLGVSYENSTDLPMTLDDFIDLAYRFANEDPNNSGEKDTYGFSQSCIRAVFGAYGNYNGFVGSSPYWFERDGKVVCADVLPENKDALAILQQCYADGVLDPEFITGENTGGYWAISQAFINGIIGASCHASIDHYRRPEVLGDDGNTCYQEFVAINGTDCYTYAPWPAGPNGDYGYSIGHAASIGENSVYNASMDDDKLAAIFGIMNACCVDDDLAILVHIGVEDETFEYVDGVPMQTITNEEKNQMGVNVYRSLYGADSPYNYTVQKLTFYDNPQYKNMLDYQANPQCDSYYTQAVYVGLPSSGQYSAELRTYRDETWIDIITGDLDVDYYDTYVEEYMNRGGSTLDQEANDWYSSK